jgi:hypothetical protein
MGGRQFRPAIGKGVNANIVVGADLHVDHRPGRGGFGEAVTRIGRNRGVVILGHNGEGCTDEFFFEDQPALRGAAQSMTTRDSLFVNVYECPGPLSGIARIFGIAIIAGIARIAKIVGAFAAGRWW